MKANHLSRPLHCSWQTLSHLALLLLLLLSILWRGGRTLEMTWLLVFVTAFVVTASFFSEKREGERPLPWLLQGGILLFVLWTLVSYVRSRVQNYGLDELFRTASLSLLFLWMARQPIGMPMRRRVLQVLAATALFACLLGMVVYTYQPVNRFVGSFFDMRFHTNYWPNAWAEFCLLAWPIILLTTRPWMAEGKTPARTTIRVIWNSLPLGVFLGSFFLSFSRAGGIVFLGQITMLAVAWRHLGIPRKRLILIAVGAFVMALMLFGSLNDLRSSRFPVLSASDKVLFQTDEKTSSITERWDFWKQAVLLSKERPLFGWGLGSFRFVQPRLARGVLATSEHAHNVFLNVALDRGWPAVLLLCVILFSILWRPLRSFRFGGSPEVVPQEQHVLLLVAVVGVLVHNLVDYNLQFVGIALPLTLLLGIIYQEAAPVRPSAQKKMIRGVEMALLFVLLLATVRETYFVVTSTLGRRAEARGDIDRALLWYGRSHGEWYSRDLYLHEAWLLSEQKKAYQRAETVLDMYLWENPEDTRGWKLKGDIAERRKASKDALAAYEKAYALGRMVNMGAVRGYLEALEEMKMKERITQEMPHMDALLQRYHDAIMVNAHFIALSQNVEDFLAIVEDLSRLYPAGEPKYQVMAANVDRQAKSVRSSAAAAAKGSLW